MLARFHHRLASSLLVAATVLGMVAPIAQAAEPEPPASLDGKFAEIATRVPGFAGAYYEADGSLVVQLVDISKLEAARAAMGDLVQLPPKPIDPPEASRRQSESGIKDPTGAIKAVQARYDFRQLQDWRMQARDVLDLPGAVSIDVDERANRVVVGVEKGDGVDQVKSYLARKGLSSDRVVVEVVEGVKPVVTLRDRVRPVDGGLQVAFSNYLCTLGFNAFAGNIRSYLVNSHCTLTRNGVDWTNHYQNTVAGANFIGQEYRDPPLFNCMVNRRCRWSDAALGAYAYGVASDLGQIARPTFWQRLIGSITIDPQRPNFQIRAERPFPLRGQMLEKVGRTTGWTWGLVTSTCVDTNVLNTNITMLCQDHVSGGSDFGDSGAPVFRWGYGSETFGNNVELFGVLWGGNSTSFVFSAMWNIEHELGPLLTN